MGETTINGLTTELVAPGPNDLLGIWDVAAGQYKKARRSNLVGAVITGSGTIDLGGFTLQVPASGVAALITQGAWVPEISTGGGAGLVHGTRAGTYVKVGSLVFLSAYVTLLSKGTASGSLYVGGFPFVVGGAPNTIYTWAVDRNNLAATYTEMIMQVAPGWTWGRLRGSPGADTSLVQLDAGILTNTTSFVFTGVYQAA